MLHSFLKITAIFLMSLPNIAYAREYRIPVQGEIDERHICAELENIFKDFGSLETERLIIRKFGATDIDVLHELLTEPGFARYQAFKKNQNRQEAQEWLDFFLSYYEANLPTLWAVEYKKTGKVIGACGFMAWYPADYRAVISYGFREEYWGQGIATEAVQAVIDLGFNTGWLNRIEARCNPLNIASIRVIKKVGMRYEGLLEQYYWNTQGTFDVEMYALLYRDWETNRSN